MKDSKFAAMALQYDFLVFEYSSTRVPVLEYYSCNSTKVILLLWYYNSCTGVLEYSSTHVQIVPTLLSLEYSSTRVLEYLAAVLSILEYLSTRVPGDVYQGITRVLEYSSTIKTSNCVLPKDRI